MIPLIKSKELTHSANERLNPFSPSEMVELKDKGEKKPFNPFEKVNVTVNNVSMKPLNLL